MLKLPQRIISQLVEKIKEPAYKRMSESYNISGYKRVYLVHIRKTGGTSLNHMFLSQGGADPRSLYSELAKKSSHRLVSQGKVFVGWNRNLINKGNYYYAFSHIPIHQLNLPDGTFTVTCFRDPVKRVMSHYKMLKGYKDNHIDHPCMAVEGQWLGNSFEEFMERIPKEYLLNQVYMFSEGLDAIQATKRVARISHVFFTEEFDQGIKTLNQKLRIDLKPIHTRATSNQDIFDSQSLMRLKVKLEPEYEMLEMIKTNSLA